MSGSLFANAVAYGSGSDYAFSVAVGDVNGDGKPDLVVANAGCDSCSGAVGVLLGNGDGTFKTAATYSSGGNYAFSVAIADLNGDGKPDLLVANLMGNTVGVLLNNGDGTFRAAVTYSSGGNNPISLAAADVNGDGITDLVVANETDNDYCGATVGVLLGNGDGTFQTAVIYGSGGCEPISVAVVDVNKDGKPDILIANACAVNTQSCESGSVGVLIGNGNGTFQTAVAYGSGGSGATAVAASDVNGDGKPDLIVANENCSDCTTSVVGVLLGNGDGTFQTAATYVSGSSGGFSSVAVNDVNEDGKPDLLVTNWGSTVGVLLGNGDGTFQRLETFSSGGGYGPDSIAAADVNGDGKPDLLVTADCFGNPVDNCTGSVSVLINTSLAPTTTALTSSINPSSYGESVTFTAAVASHFTKTHLTGTVSFFDGSIPLGAAQINGESIATISISTLTTGAHSITAIYSGDQTFAPSTSQVLNQVVVQTSTGTKLSSYPNASRFGQPVNLTAVVFCACEGDQIPTGTVTYYNGSNAIGSAALADQTAVLTYEFFSVGRFALTAVYNGDSNFSPSTSPIWTQTVAKATASIALTSSLNPSSINESVTFTAAVSAGPSVPTGSVTFKQGAKVLGTVPLSNGQASFTTTFTKAGHFAIAADYSGDQDYLPKAAKPVKQVVEKAVK